MTTTPSATEPGPTTSTLAGPKVLLIGPSGSGKTYSARSLVEAGLETFCLFTEPGYATVLGDIPSDKLHWMYVPPASQSWDTMIDSANKINTMSFEALASIKGGVNKSDHAQFIEVLRCFNNYTCARTGESFGDISSWGPDRALFVDSLTGLNQMAMNLVVGSKPVKAMGDWGVAMDNLERLVQKLCMDTRCTFVLTAHVEREFNEVSGAIQLMVSTLGKKLAPRIPHFFDDAVFLVREDKSWRWSTTFPGVDLKARNLEWSDKLEPSFVPLLNAWRKRTGGVQA